ncbi:MAG: nitroreductase/quinone reductase family protein [Mycobacterium sp.]
MPTRYEEPNRAARAANATIRWLAEMGISIAGTRALRVRGRKSGKQRAVVINLLTVDGVDYLVSPRGNTQWARNVRAAGVIELGPRWRRKTARVTEVGDPAKPELLRRYLARWYWQVKGYVAGLTPDSSE